MKKMLKKVAALTIALVMLTALANTVLAEEAEIAEIAEVVEVALTVEEIAEEAVAEETVEATAEPTVEATVEPTVEATVEPTVEATAEATVAPEATEVPEDAQLVSVIEDALNADRSVSVYAIFDGESVNLGDRITLKAVLKGYEGTSYSLQWQVSSDNANWANVLGETDAEYSFTVDTDNASNYYRVAVTIDGVEIAE